MMDSFQNSFEICINIVMDVKEFNLGSLNPACNLDSEDFELLFLSGCFSLRTGSAICFANIPLY